jgi:2-methylcitrate dehydratase PrpD
VAASRLLGLDVGQMANAIVLAATTAGGLHAAADTSVSREYHAGSATMLGIEAALAAQRGYTGEETLFEKDHGFCAVYGGTDGAAITRDFGKSWDIVTDMAVKLVPGGHPHHALAEAAANAAREGDVSPDAVEAIVLSRPGVTALSGPMHPANLIDMAHSPAYFLAAGVADRDFGWAHASPEKIGDPVIHRLIDKVRVGPQPTEDVDKYRQGATVTIETVDGRSVTSTVFVPKGAGCLGIDWTDIDAKYRTLAPRAPLSDGQVETSLTLIRNFRDADGAESLIKALR